MRPQVLSIVCLVLAVAGRADTAAAQSLAADVAYQEASSGAVTLIDVRSPSEWHETGVPRHAWTVTIHDPGGPDAFVAAVLAAVGGDRTRPIALICASGGRSHAAQTLLAAHGFTALVDVTEGVLGNGDLPGWRDRGLPLEPCAEC
jgi:rhodanese-related sulfurtransferase